MSAHSKQWMAFANLRSNVLPDDQGQEAAKNVTPDGFIQPMEDGSDWKDIAQSQGCIGKRERPETPQSLRSPAFPRITIRSSISQYRHGKSRVPYFHSAAKGADNQYLNKYLIMALYPYASAHSPSLV
jgi:hypothetical protein